MKFMRFFRLFLPVLFAFALLAAQQDGAAHAISHALSDALPELTHKQDKQASHSHHTCEKCAIYAQLGSAPIMGTYDFALPAVSGEAIQHRDTSFSFARVLVAVARGPPAVRIL